MISDMDTQVTLQPVEEDDLPLLEKLTWDQEATGEFERLGWFDRRRWRRGWAENCLLGTDGGVLAVANGSQRLGFMNWRRQAAGPVAYSWIIGIALLPEARGRGYGTQAHRLLVRYLFANTPVHRIAADTDIDNVAEQRALEKAGFTREGISRGIGWRDGAWRDGVNYSVLRTDPPA
jgi:RimJ/RimL family protein N-acetyltransferase